MRILLVEDTVMMAKAVIELLRDQGHEVTWVAGFNDPQKPILIDSDRDEVDLCPGDFELVFLDGDLLDHKEGKDLVPVFNEANLPCFGTSTINEMNDEMIEAGAIGAIGKAVWLLALVHNRVTPEQFAECSDETIAELEAVEADSKSDSDFRKAADALLRKHL